MTFDDQKKNIILSELKNTKLLETCEYFYDSKRGQLGDENDRRRLGWFLRCSGLESGRGHKFQR